MFASRLQRAPGRNRLSVAIEHRLAAGLPVINLTESNPTRAGFAYPSDLLAPLAEPSALHYDPQPFGMQSARQAVAEEFRRRQVEVSADRVVLTASTSEAYSLLFKLLCNPGDAVLVPRPSYPLIDHLTQLDGVIARHYALGRHGGWAVDVDAIRDALESSSHRIRAVVLVSPNNPTGSVVAGEELARLAALAAAHRVALIADEVFADYPIQNLRVTSVLSQAEALTFGLGGLSKSIGLPQVKLGWIGVSGPGPLVAAALERLETICDAYLSVSTPVQTAAAELLRRGAAVRGQIQTRVRINAAALGRVAADHPACTLLPIAAGWYAVLQIPAVKAEEIFVIDLLERTGVLVHPGYFFDFDREAFLVVSLLPEPGQFSASLSTLFSEIERLS
jgi:alanine-synthesizing transaminase